MSAYLQLAFASVPLPVGQFAGGAAPSSTGVSPVWFIGTTLVACFSLLLCLWLLWRMRTVGKAVKALGESRGEPVTIPGGLGFFPRFSTRTLLVLFTLVAIVLGMFGSELMRARRQANALDYLNSTGNVDCYITESYRLGILGDSHLAGLICDWVHPHFGCHLTHLSLQLYYDEDGETLLTYSNFEAIGALNDLDSLQLVGIDISQESLASLAQLDELRRLSLRNCRLPENPLSVIGELRRLEFLELRNCALRDQDLRGISSLVSLSHLDLADNSITDDSLESFSGLSELRFLDLTRADITGDGLEHLVPLDQLVKLILVDTDIAAEQIGCLVQLPRLQELLLCGTRSERDLHPSEYQKLERLFKEHPYVEIYWHSPKEPDEWEFEDNRPSGSFWWSGNGSGFGSPPPPNGSGYFSIPPKTRM